VALSIDKAVLSDSGTYACSDDDGMGPDSTAQLTVFGMLYAVTINIKKN